MSRKFSEKECALFVILGILIVICVYLTFVHFPVTEAVAVAEAEQSAIMDELAIEQARALRKTKMEAKIEEAIRDEGRKPLADYNNNTNVVAFLNNIMAQTDQYDLTFHQVVFAENTALRAIDMTFSCEGYDTVRAITDALYACPYYNQVTGLTILAGDNRTGIEKKNVTAKLSVVFYEYCEQTGADALMQEIGVN